MESIEFQFVDSVLRSSHQESNESLRLLRRSFHSITMLTFAEGLEIGGEKSFGKHGLLASAHP